MEVPPLLKTEFSSLPKVTLGATVLACAVPSAPTINAKIRNVARGHAHAFVVLSTPEVCPGGFEIRRLAFRELMNMKRVFSGKKVLDVQSDLNSLGSGERRCPRPDPGHF
jgi:hypothetical protein